MYKEFVRRVYLDCLTYIQQLGPKSPSESHSVPPHVYSVAGAPESLKIPQCPVTGWGSLEEVFFLLFRLHAKKTPEGVFLACRTCQKNPSDTCMPKKTLAQDKKTPDERTPCSRHVWKYPFAADMPKKPLQHAKKTPSPLLILSWGIGGGGPGVQRGGY